MRSFSNVAPPLPKYCGICRRLITDKSVNTCTLCRDKRRIRAQRARISLRVKVFNAYGGPVCTCCNERKGLDFLQIDHVNNDGAAHRREFKETRGKGIYTWLSKNKFPYGFQVLCADCNFAKRVGECPHVAERKLMLGRLSKLPLIY